MKKILLTNHNIMHFSGSEIDTITLANYFLKQGFDVTIFTMELGYPLLGKINSKIKILDYDLIEQLNDFYDIIWSHHFPLLDYLLFKKRIKANYIHYVSLSSYMVIESLPDYYKDLSLISVLSKETLLILKQEGYDISGINIFPNYATEEYFNKNIVKEKLKKIAIISNHIPKEILEFETIAKNNNYLVDIYGIGYNYTLVDSKILSKYDLIISIGKTVNYAIALGIPVYVYDRFGGDLYITKDNIEKLFEYNFSGRAYQNKLTGNEIFTDIVNNYYNVLNQQEELKQFARDNFSLENNLNRTLNILFKKEKFNIDKFLLNNKNINRTKSLFVEEMGKKINILKLYSKYIDCCQIFFDIGNGFNEENSYTKNYLREKNNINKIYFEIPKKYKKLRLDFSNKSFIYVKSIKINNKEFILFDKNNLIAYQKGFISINDDPSIVIMKEDLKTNKLHIKIEMEQLDSIKVINDLIINAREDERIIQKHIYENKYLNKKILTKIKKKIKKNLKKRK